METMIEMDRPGCKAADTTCRVPQQRLVPDQALPLRAQVLHECSRNRSDVLAEAVPVGAQERAARHGLRRACSRPLGRCLPDSAPRLIGHVSCITCTCCCKVSAKQPTEGVQRSAAIKH